MLWLYEQGPGCKIQTLIMLTWRAFPVLSCLLRCWTECMETAPILQLSSTHQPHFHLRFLFTAQWPWQCSDVTGVIDVITSDVIDGARRGGAGMFYDVTIPYCNTNHRLLIGWGNHFPPRPLHDPDLGTLGQKQCGRVKRFNVYLRLFFSRWVLIVSVGGEMLRECRLYTVRNYRTAILDDV